MASRNGHRSNGHGTNGRARGARTPTIPVRPGRAGDAKPPRGTLLIVGGHEDKAHDQLILRALVERVGKGRLVVATVASQEPDELWRTYRKVFRALGVDDVAHLDIGSRVDGMDESRLAVLDGATAVFFTGGDQLKITSQIGDTPSYERIRQIYVDGGTIAGTSAGASVVCETMLVGGTSDTSYRIGSHGLQMAPGLGLLAGAIVDQHFAERGRIGRLIAAVAQNPRILGIGIDENTAIVCDDNRSFRVIGSGAVYVVDGAGITYSNLTEEETDRVLSTYDVRLHVLSMGDEFDLATRRPLEHPAEEMEREIDRAVPLPKGSAAAREREAGREKARAKARDEEREPAGKGA